MDRLIPTASRPTPEAERRTVRDVVLEHPATAATFERFGIDYCCGGGQSLAEACQKAGCSIEQLTSAVEQNEGAAAERDWRDAPLGELAQHIVERHHSFTRKELPRLDSLLAKVVSAHGKDHPELWRVQRSVGELCVELLEHMQKEEALLFPYISELEQAALFSRRPPEPIFGTIQNPVAAMIMEHEASGQVLETLRDLTGNYAVPPEACASFRVLYEALPAFAADLHQHIHLENNILFPRAVELEEQLNRTSR
jgi:regulator of cell morphogenesis and NO signaling